MDEIKEFSWEHRVRRTGFLQSKGIVNEAEVIRLPLTPSISAKYDNVFWVQDLNLYDDAQTKFFSSLFKDAFEEEKRWPMRIIAFFDDIAPKVEELIKIMKQTTWKEVSPEHKQSSLIEYVGLLKSIQNYYVIAVPLTNYCEKILEKYPQIIKESAFAHKPLDIDAIHSSKNPLQEFAWLKTGYNKIQEVTEHDFSNIHSAGKGHTSSNIPDKLKPFVVGLQIGIYTRNRMKELSQQLWYYFEPLANAIANELGLERDDFFMMTYHEVLKSYKEKGVVVSRDQIKARHECFVIGILDNKEIIISGQEAQDLVSFFDTVPQTHEIKGRTACEGVVEGKVRVIKDPSQFKEFEKGEILVTSMTTPDFVVIMGKAAAIVTDEGGLSCHAAIVSREMEVPCIIGTDVATKILKTGDMVKVDATRGVVEKL